MTSTEIIGACYGDIISERDVLLREKIIKFSNYVVDKLNYRQFGEKARYKIHRPTVLKIEIFEKLIECENIFVKTVEYLMEFSINKLNKIKKKNVNRRSKNDAKKKEKLVKRFAVKIDEIKTFYNGELKRHASNYHMINGEIKLNYVDEYNSIKICVDEWVLCCRNAINGDYPSQYEMAEICMKYRHTKSIYLCYALQFYKLSASDNYKESDKSLEKIVYIYLYYHCIESNLIEIIKWLSKACKKLNHDSVYWYNANERLDKTCDRIISYYDTHDINIDLLRCVKWVYDLNKKGFKHENMIMVINKEINNVIGSNNITAIIEEYLYTNEINQYTVK